jgi:hypothetical protein
MANHVGKTRQQKLQFVSFVLLQGKYEFARLHVCRKISLPFDDGNHSVNTKIVHWRFLEWTGYESLLNPSYYCF